MEASLRVGISSVVLSYQGSMIYRATRTKPTFEKLLLIGHYVTKCGGNLAPQKREKDHSKTPHTSSIFLKFIISPFLQARTGHLGNELVLTSFVIKFYACPNCINHVAM